jgi:valyl-tRNA synthetase
MLEKTYNPAEIEARIHQEWETAEAFKAGRPERVKATPYTIVIPPPNVTGSLHMGHALNNTLQDILCRFERMRGRDVLWQPGTDHAGIATQMVVERQLMERQQPDRRKMGRDKFIETVWAWKEESGGTITNQLKRLGASCDWSRDTFTMGKAGHPDDQMMRAVTKVFVELHKAGLIYKDKRLVNWDPKFQSAISDLEVEPREIKGSFKWADGDKDKEGNPVAFDSAALNKLLTREPGGHLYYFRYPLQGKTFNPHDATTFIRVATTRPETMLGDTGIAVNPKDERFTPLVGTFAVLPLVGRDIKIVADDYSDPEKGTGAVKITPAHDFNDFDVGKRTGLPQINIFDAFAQLNDAVPAAYRGMDRFDARKRIVADMAAGNFLEKIEPTAQVVPHGDRSGVPIEPWLTDQWYVDAATMAKPALAAVREGKTRFIPEKYADDYFRWLDNIQPWCISRQLWWGHQIPAWYGPKIAGKELNYAMDDSNHANATFVAASEHEALALAEVYYGCPVIVSKQRNAEAEDVFFRQLADGLPFKQVQLWRDPDVLDTWFSSALWPFSTLGWPDKTPELNRYYPTNTLVTGFDIIFFWVARMMMSGIHFMGEPPFKDVYIHALVRDEKGQKMSKSKGNVIDPLSLIDQYGADALRFTLAAMAAQGRDIKLSTSRVEGYRNFATKLWNASRFAEMNECVRQKGFDPKTAKVMVNRWIGGETAAAVARVRTAIEAYKFNEAANAAYEFTWGTFCDWYVELTKPILAGSDEAAKAETRAMTAWVLDQILKMLHPFMPFITEELWSRMVEVGIQREAMLCLSTWPELNSLGDAESASEIGWLVDLISEVRSVRSEMNVPGGAKIPLVMIGATDAIRARAGRHTDTIQRMARIEDITFAASAPKGAAQLVAGETTIALPLAGVIDMAAEKQRLAKEIGSAKGDLAKMDAKLSNASFMERAKPEAIEETQERKAELEQILAKLAVAMKRVEQVG